MEKEALDIYREVEKILEEKRKNKEKVTLRFIRQTKGMTQVRLSELCGISQSRLSTYEKGKLRMTPQMARRIAGVLGVSVSLFTDYQDHTPTRIKKVPSLRKLKLDEGEEPSLLYHYRLERGLSQKELAERIGGQFTQARISRLERGIDKMTKKTAMQIAAALKEPVSLFYEIPYGRSGKRGPYNIQKKCLSSIGKKERQV
jgi:transcriptional regulator with XRE-family HTH domain